MVSAASTVRAGSTVRPAAPTTHPTHLMARLCHVAVRTARAVKCVAGGLGSVGCPLRPLASRLHAGREGGSGDLGAGWRRRRDIWERPERPPGCPPAALGCGERAGRAGVESSPLASLLSARLGPTVSVAARKPRHLRPSCAAAASFGTLCATCASPAQPQLSGPAFGLTYVSVWRRLTL